MLPQRCVSAPLKGNLKGPEILRGWLAVVLGKDRFEVPTHWIQSSVRELIASEQRAWRPSSPRQDEPRKKGHFLLSQVLPGRGGFSSRYLKREASTFFPEFYELT